MTDNPLLDLADYRQSVWLDDIRRGLLGDGTLRRLIENDGVSGVTTNPSIFEKAIVEGHDYDAALRAAARRAATPAEIGDRLMREDVAAAADLLSAVYDRTEGRDGYVSLEVSPHLAHDTEATVREAQRLWAELGRPNLMIKVPATREGLPALRRLIAEGINVNCTLLFSVARYAEAAEAYLDALEARHAAGQPLHAVSSVASFFVSRIDTKVDARLDACGAPRAAALRGQAAIACARLAYQHFLKLSAQPRWQALAARGARPQRLLWASTSTKEARYSDIKYVEALIGRDTVTTLPLATLTAYRDHGRPAPRLEEHLDRAVALPAELAALGIELEAIAAQLEDEGLRKFVEPFDRIQRHIAARLSAAGP